MDRAAQDAAAIPRVVGQHGAAEPVDRPEGALVRRLRGQQRDVGGSDLGIAQPARDVLLERASSCFGVSQRWPVERGAFEAGGSVSPW